MVDAPDEEAQDDDRWQAPWRIGPLPADPYFEDPYAPDPYG
jgi:hypothetical protein